MRWWQIEGGADVLNDPSARGLSSQPWSPVHPQNLGRPCREFRGGPVEERRPRQNPVESVVQSFFKRIVVDFIGSIPAQRPRIEVFPRLGCSQLARPEWDGT